MSKIMAVVHVKKRENPYVQIDKRVFEDTRLSWRAKGIMGYLLSKPNGWKVNVVDIWGKGKEGRNAVQDCMSELKEYGYADLVTTHNEQGVFTGKEWVISEEPKGGFTDVTEKPKTDAPKIQKSVFRSISNNDLNSNNEEGRESEEKTTHAPATFDEMMERVNAEAVEAKKEKESPKVVDVVPIEPRAYNSMQAYEIIESWCKGHVEQIRWSYDVARRKLTPEDLHERIIDFVGHYATTSEKQTMFFQDPARMFQNGLTRWLQRQNQFDREQEAKQPKKEDRQPAAISPNIRRF